MPFSDDANELLGSFVGYRARSYGVYNRPMPYEDVIRYEVGSMGNIHMINEIERALELKQTTGLKRSVQMSGSSSNEYIIQTLYDIFDVIAKRFGADALVMWFASKRGVRGYLNQGEQPTSHRIPRSAIMISDLGSEGQLFLAPRRDWA